MNKYTATFLFEQFFSIFSLEKKLLVKTLIPTGIFTFYIYLISLFSWASDNSLSYALHINSGGYLLFSILMSFGVYLHAICFYVFLFYIYGKDPLQQKHIIFIQIKNKIKELFFYQLFVLANFLFTYILYQIFFNNTGFFTIIIGIVVSILYTLVVLGVLLFNVFGIIIKSKSFVESTSDSLIYSAVHLNIIFGLLFLMFMLVSLSFITLFLGFILVIYTLFYFQIKVGIPLAEDAQQRIQVQN